MDRRKFVSSGLATSMLMSTNVNTIFDSVNFLEGTKKWKSLALFSPDHANEVLLSFKQDLYTKNRIGLEFTDVQAALSNPAEIIAELISGKFDLAILPPFALNKFGPEAEYFGQYSNLSPANTIEEWHQKPETKAFWNNFFAANNLVPFHFGRCESGGLWSKRKITNIADFLKLKIRLMGHALEDISSLGGNSEFSTYTSVFNQSQIEANEGFSPHLDASLSLKNGFNYYYLGWPKQLSYMGLFIKKSSYESLSLAEKNSLSSLILTYHKKLTTELAIKDTIVLQKLKAASPEFIQTLPDDVSLALKDKYEKRLASLKISVPRA